MGQPFDHSLLKKLVIRVLEERDPVILGQSQQVHLWHSFRVDGSAKLLNSPMQESPSLSQKLTSAMYNQLNAAGMVDYLHKTGGGGNHLPHHK